MKKVLALISRKFLWMFTKPLSRNCPVLLRMTSTNSLFWDTSWAIILKKWLRNSPKNWNEFLEFRCVLFYVRPENFWATTRPIWSKFRIFFIQPWGILNDLESIWKCFSSGKIRNLAKNNTWDYSGVSGKISISGFLVQTGN